MEGRKCIYLIIIYPLFIPTIRLKILDGDICQGQSRMWQQLCSKFFVLQAKVVLFDTLGYWQTQQKLCHNQELQLLELAVEF